MISTEPALNEETEDVSALIQECVHLRRSPSRPLHTPPALDGQEGTWLGQGAAAVAHVVFM